MFNMANDGYLSVKGLRSIGVDAHLYYVSPTHVASLVEWEEGQVDYPKLGSQDSPNMLAFKFTRPDWIHPVFNQQGNAILFTRNLLSELSDFDLIVGHYPFAQFLYHLQFQHRIAKPYIIYEAGMLRLLDNPNHPERDVMRVYRDAPLIIYANVDMEPLLRLHGLEKHSTYLPLPVDTDKSLPAKHENDHLVFLHPTRHYHQEKGNDRLLAAFAEYVKRNPKAELRLCDWGGEDLAASKMLIYRYNLAGNVTWLPLMGKLDLIKEYQHADAVFDQYIYGATGSVTPEALSCGKPVCTRIVPELFRYWHGSAPPVLNAQEPHQIYEAMIQLEDKNLRERVGEEGRKWVCEQQSLKFVAEHETDIHRKVLEALK